MDKYKRYMGLIIFIIAVVIMINGAVFIIVPQYNHWTELKDNVVSVSETLQQKKQAKATIVAKLKKLQASILSSQKKIYSPVESKLDNDTLFFTLYSDLIEMARANTIKIKSIDYKYNPEGDIFVKQKGNKYFVCDVNLEVVSNYVNLGKFIQDIYQYPYYIKINSIDVVPYQQDKKILLSTISMRLYTHTYSEKELLSDMQEGNADMSSDQNSNNSLNNATTPLPQ